MADPATSGPELIEDDGTLLLARAATDNAGLLAFADAIDEQIPKANEALRFADLVSSEQGKAAFSDPSMRARFAQQSDRNLLAILEALQQQIEKSDGVAAESGEARMARKALARFAQSAQERLEAAREKVAALLRILGPDAGVPLAPVKRSKWGAEVEADAPLHEKYKDVFEKQKAQQESGNGEKPAWQAAREEKEQAAREKVQQRKDAERQQTGNGDLKPIVVKYQGRGEKPPPSDNLYIKGLPGNVTEEDVEAIFSQVGKVMSQKLKAADWGAIAFVRMANRAEAAAAIERFHGTVPDRLRTLKPLAPAAAAERAAAAGGDAAAAPLGPPQKSTEEGIRMLQLLTFVRMDLSEPLGATFDDDCVVLQLTPGSQGFRLGIPVGARLKAFGGKAVTKGVQQLAKRIGKAKKSDLKEVVLGYSPPPLTATFAERPFGLGLGLDEALGLFVVEDAQGHAKAKGVIRGMALVSINDAALVGLTIDECIQCLREAPLPARLLFKRVPRGGAGAVEGQQQDEAVVLSSDDEGGKVVEVGEEEDEPGEEEDPETAKKALQALQRLLLVTVDLSQPLGIGFDDQGVATKIGDGTQAAKLGIPKGAQAKAVGGLPLTLGTKQLVRRIQRAKGKGMKDLAIAFRLSAFKVALDATPDLSVGRDPSTGLFVVRDAGGAAKEKGVQPGLALLSIGGDGLFGRTEAQVARLLRAAQLPVTLVFQPVPPEAPPEGVGTAAALSASEDEGETAAAAAKRVAAAGGQPESEGPAAAAAAPPPAKRAKPPEAPEGPAAPASSGAAEGRPAESKERLWYVRISLSEPLGVKFDDSCTAVSLAPGMQAERLRLPKGARARFLGGRTLGQKTGELVKVMQKAKQKGLKEVVMGFALPPTEATFQERPFGFAVEVEGDGSACTVSLSRGAALEQGIRPGSILLAVGADSVAGLSKDEAQRRIKQAPLPVVMTFWAPPADSVPPESGPVVSDSEDERGAKRPRLDAPAEPSSGSQAPARPTAPAAPAAAGAALLDQPAYFRIDLSKPLGIFFDKKCTVERVGPGSQAELLGIRPGARAVAVGRQALAGATEELVKRLQAAKQEGRKELALGLLPAPVAVELAERPLPFMVQGDAALGGLLVVREASGTVEAAGVRPGWALVSAAGQPVAGLTEDALAALLREAALPLPCAFRRLPRPDESLEALGLGGADGEG